MKGYKASIKGKCKNQVYEVGKTYKIEFESEAEIELCERGFHFCQKPNDVFKYYDLNNNNLVIFEVEAIGNIKSSSEKSVTDEIKIIQEIPKQEYNSIFTNYEFKFDSNDNLILLKVFGGYSVEYKYDKHNNKILEKDSNGYIIEYKYDENNNLIWLKDTDCDIWEYKYDENNNLILVKTSDCDIWEFKYDSNNNKIWEKDSNGTIWEYKYDYNNLILVKSSEGFIKEYPSYKVICS